MRIVVSVTIALLASALLAVGASARTGCAFEPSWGAVQPSLEKRVLTLVNAHRAKLGLRALKLEPTLEKSARWKSLHMARYEYFAHEDEPIGRSVPERLLACGFPAGRRGWAENIAWGYPTAAAVMQGWLNSPGHRSNIEQRAFRTIGVGVARDQQGRLFWTQNFGT